MLDSFKLIDDDCDEDDVEFPSEGVVDEGSMRLLRLFPEGTFIP